MADDVRLNPGVAGELIAADDVGGKMHQRVKVGHGADGSYTDTSSTDPFPTSIHDFTDGEAARITNGGLDVNVQDQHTKPFDVFFREITGTGITLQSAASLDSYAASFTTGHGILVGDQVVMYDSVSTRVYVAQVLATATNTVSFDMPLNYSYPVATTTVIKTAIDLNVDGSVTRQTFSVGPPIDKEVDITRIMFQMITTAQPEMDAFGDIAGGLLRGLAVRIVNGETVNLFNAKTNGELANLMYDLQFYDATRFGVFGVAGRMTYAGQNKHGVTVRLALGDSLEVIVQDDLTSLISFRMIACGHAVEN